MRLRLDTIDLYHVQIPLREPFPCGPVEVRVKDAIVLRVQTSRGTGWGECSIPLDIHDAGDAVRAAWDALCERVGPAALTMSEIEPEAFSEALSQHTDRSNPRAGLEIALWQAAATGRDLPLYSLLGGVSQPIASGVCLGVRPTIDDLLARIARDLADGCRRVKIRITPDWDIEPVARVRQEWPDLPLVVDACGCYRLDQMQTLRNLDKYELAAIEQPLPAEALDESARLQAAIRTPICLTASVRNAEAVRHIAKQRAARIISVDVQRAGGLAPAMKIHAAARKAGLTCWLGTTPDLGIGAAAGLQLATLDAFVHPTDIGSSGRWLADDLLEPPIVVDAGGYLHLPDGPGFGYRPSVEKVEKYTLEHETLTA